MDLFYLYATTKSEIDIGSNKHETCLVLCKEMKYRPAHEILVLITCAQKPFNGYAYISRDSRGLNFGLSLHLHSYYVYVSSEGNG